MQLRPHAAMLHALVIVASIHQASAMSPAVGAARNIAKQRADDGLASDMDNATLEDTGITAIQRHEMNHSVRDAPAEAKREVYLNAAVEAILKAKAEQEPVADPASSAEGEITHTPKESATDNAEAEQREAREAGRQAARQVKGVLGDILYKINPINALRNAKDASAERKGSPEVSKLERSLSHTSQGHTHQELRRDKAEDGQSHSNGRRSIKDTLSDILHKMNPAEYGFADTPDLPKDIGIKSPINIEKDDTAHTSRELTKDDGTTNAANVGDDHPAASGGILNRIKEFPGYISHVAKSASERLAPNRTKMDGDAHVEHAIAHTVPEASVDGKRVTAMQHRESNLSSREASLEAAQAIEPRNASETLVMKHERNAIEDVMKTELKAIEEVMKTERKAVEEVDQAMASPNASETVVMKTDQKAVEEVDQALEANMSCTYWCAKDVRTWETKCVFKTCGVCMECGAKVIESRNASETVVMEAEKEAIEEVDQAIHAIDNDISDAEKSQAALPVAEPAAVTKEVNEALPGPVQAPESDVEGVTVESDLRLEAINNEIDAMQSGESNFQSIEDSVQSSQRVVGDTDRQAAIWAGQFPIQPAVPIQEPRASETLAVARPRVLAEVHPAVDDKLSDDRVAVDEVLVNY